jgi:hypothetical protein
MERLAPIQFPAAVDAEEDAALNELDVAIALVTGGAAVRVRIASLRTSIADQLAPLAAARAGAAHVAFSVDRSAEMTTLTVGPRLRVVAAS